MLRGEQPAILDRKLFEAIFRSQKRLAIGPDMSGTVPTWAPGDALRFCPAGVVAEVGLRWCGARPSSTERRISMSKSAKKRSPSKSASSAPSAKPSRRTVGDTRPENINSGSKQSRVLAMLQSPAGATIAAVMKATGWQAHSVRGFLAGVVRKRLKLELGSTKVDGNRVYQITKRDAGTTISTRQSKRDAA